MFSVKTIVAILAFGAASVAAAPAPAPEPVASPAAVGLLAVQSAVRMCKDSEWRGDCKTVLVDLGVCTNISGDYNDKISSIENQSSGNTKCTWYIDGNCNGSSYSNQKDAKLQDGNGKFNDSISSFSCTTK
ncbi:hypothetical protein B0T17DRAFT_367999 [Bombardia bombarda]|uniref:Uncharacterized protein n=1 Tax=Bombardia bombarda TaxID=252184 RepID=A0AA39WIN2_9PEZI|nr:hypothetical protein B0T17DRAFT_367999 [Bombardia bombarda]